MRGQISIEMILLLAAILAIAFLLVTQLRSTAGQAGETVHNKSSEIINMVNSTGPYCTSDSYCQSLGYSSCDTTSNTCI